MDLPEPDWPMMATNSPVDGERHRPGPDLALPLPLIINLIQVSDVYEHGATSAPGLFDIVVHETSSFSLETFLDLPHYSCRKGR